MGVNTTKSVDQNPTTHPPISQRMKQAWSGRRISTPAFPCTRTRTVNRRSNTWLTNSTMILRNARNLVNVSRPGNRPHKHVERAVNVPGTSYWFPPQSYNTPWKRRMTGRGILSAGSLEICQRSGQKQISWRVPMQQGLQSCQSSHPGCIMAQADVWLRLL